MRSTPAHRECAGQRTDRCTAAAKALKGDHACALPLRFVRMFRAVDKNDDGAISKNELRNGQY